MSVIIVLVFLAYALGSLPSGYVLGKLAGVDVRTVGSGNIGATNVARAIGKWQGALTLVADASKGFLPVLIAKELEWDALPIAAVAIAAFLGHLFPLFLKFQGGKGVATASGSLMAIAPLATLLLLGLFTLVVLLSRMVSLGALAAALAAPLVLWFFYQPPPIIAMACFLAAMIVVRHRGNIQRMWAGTEPRVGRS